MTDMTEQGVLALYLRLNKEAESSGYHVNPNPGFAKSLVQGLLVNDNRYGYLSCPCRLGSGKKADDLDIICPCDYRDRDIDRYGACYCGLYVSDKIYRGEQKLSSIPESRPTLQERLLKQVETEAFLPSSGGRASPYPMWRCKVCGYLCARESPPEKCPICGVGRERFERFI
jgi:ferredoxin-thioredoxin reductase catalytic subunit